MEIVPYFVTNIHKGLFHQDYLALYAVKFRNINPHESWTDHGTSSWREASSQYAAGSFHDRCSGCMRPDTGTSLLKIGRKQDISGNRGKENGKDQGDDSKMPLQGRQDSGQAGKTAKRH